MSDNVLLRAFFLLLFFKSKYSLNYIFTTFKKHSWHENSLICTFLQVISLQACNT